MILCSSHNVVLTKQRNADTAAAELGRKMRLEQAFMRELRSLFSKMRNEFRVSVAATGSPVQASVYQQEWQALLSNHYTRVQRAFRREVLDQNGQKSLGFWLTKQNEEETEEVAAFALLEWIRQTAPQQAALITRTNEADIQKALTQARQQLIEDNEPLVDRNIAASASAVLTARFASRIPLISQTETQDAAEATKQIRAEAMAGVEPFPVSGRVRQPLEGELDIACTWDTITDGRERAAHRQANGQTISITEVFIVAGERLRFPGDPSLGASISNLARCRCSKRFEVQ